MSGATVSHFTERSTVKVVPLSHIREHLLYPTALFKPRYNIIIQITAGTIRAQVGFEAIIAGASSVLLMLSDRIIAREFLSDDLEGYGMIIEDSAFPALLSRTQIHSIFEAAPLIRLSGQDCDMLAGLNTVLAAECCNPQPNIAFMHALAQAVLLKLLERSTASVPVSRAEEIAFGYKHLVYQHFRQEHGVAFYASRLNVSESHLNRCVKSTFRKSSKEVWSEVIIRYSQVALQDASKAVSEVAYELNFADPSYFGRLFRQIVGVSPTAYRSRMMQHLSGHLRQQ